MNESSRFNECGNCGVPTDDVSQPCSACDKFVFHVRQLCSDCQKPFTGRVCARCFSKSPSSRNEDLLSALKKAIEEHEHAFAFELAAELSRQSVDIRHPIYLPWTQNLKATLTDLTRIVSCSSPLEDALNYSDRNAALSDYLSNSYIEGLHFGRLRSGLSHALQKAADLENINDFSEAVDLLEYFIIKCPTYSPLRECYQRLSSGRVPWDDNELRRELSTARLERRYQHVLFHLTLLLPGQMTNQLRMEANKAVNEARAYFSTGKQLLAKGRPTDARIAFQSALAVVTDFHEATVGLARAVVEERLESKKGFEEETTKRSKRWLWRR